MNHISVEPQDIKCLDPSMLAVNKTTRQGPQDIDLTRRVYIKTDATYVFALFRSHTHVLALVLIFTNYKERLSVLGHTAGLPMQFRIYTDIEKIIPPAGPYAR